MGSAGTRLINDDLGIRETLAPALSPTSQGRPAGGAAAASEALCTHPFDLILFGGPFHERPGRPVCRSCKRGG